MAREAARNDLPQDVRRLLFLLQAYLPRIGAGEYAKNLSAVTLDAGLHAVVLGETGIVVRASLVEVQSQQAGRVWRRRYAVSVAKESGEPAQVVLEGARSVMSVLDVVGGQLASLATADLPELPQELALDGITRPELLPAD